jgi:acyl-CoA hydrolase
MVSTTSLMESLHTFTVFPDDLNYAGTLFGGKILAEMDIAAANTARRMLYHLEYDGVVTARLDSVDFIAPALLGDIIEMRSIVKRTGNTSMVISVSVLKEDQKGKRANICEAHFTFVVMKDGKPCQHFLSPVV